jgi:FtsZ-interacting cell division protein YlmF
MTGVLRKMKAWLFAEDGDSFDSQVYDPEADPAPRRRSRLIPIHSRSGEIFIRRPRNQEDAQICVDCLRGRRAVVINLKDVAAEEALRVFDFLSGATYALGGHAEQAGDNVYLLTPQSIGIMAEEEVGAAPRSEAWQEI